MRRCLPPRRGSGARTNFNLNASTGGRPLKIMSSGDEHTADASAVWVVGSVTGERAQAMADHVGHVADQLWVGEVTEALGPPRLDFVLAPRLGQCRMRVAQGRHRVKDSGERCRAEIAPDTFDAELEAND